MKAPDAPLIVTCRYCGEPAIETVEEQVVIGASEIFSRRYSTCGLCTSLRRDGLGLDPSWSAEDAPTTWASTRATVRARMGPMA